MVEFITLCSQIDNDKDTPVEQKMFWSKIIQVVTKNGKQTAIYRKYPDLEVYYDNEVGSKLLDILNDKRIMDNYAIDVIDAFTEKLHELKIKYISNSENDMKYDKINQQLIFYMNGNIYL